MPAHSTYTVEVGDEICARIADGESLRTICLNDAMPGRRTVLDWLDGDGVEFAAFRAKYARAREAQGDVMDDMIMTEAMACDNGNALSARVRIDAFKWRAAKLKPKVYGDKLGIGQADGMEPVKLGVAVEFVKSGDK